MRIIPFSSFSTHKESFGYNKSLDKELTKKLENDSSDSAQIIKNLRTFCNGTEDYIISMEKSKNKSVNLKNTIDSLIVSKHSLVQLVEDAYPELNYKKRETKHYNTEASKTSYEADEITDYWRFTLANMLSAESLTPAQSARLEKMKVHGEVVSSSIPEEMEKPDPLEAIAMSMKAMVNIMSKQSEPASPPSQKPKELPDIIVPFVPKDGSPKGFESIGGMTELKEILRDKIIFPLLHPEKAALDLKEYGKKYPRAVLFYGPPGCGKTFITEALAQESGLPMYYLKIGKAGSEYINKTSQNYEKAFSEAENKAKETGKPVIMFIDEIDGLTKGRDSKSGGEDLKQIGTLLDLISNARGRNIIVIAATNKFDIVDDAIKRRFDEQIYIGFPDEKARESVLVKALEPRTKAQKLLYNSAAMKKIAQKTEGFSNDDLCVFADKAAYLARKDGRREIILEDFVKVIEENQGRKIKEDKYVPKSQRRPIGFNKNC
ncbi:MAG: ATP-binding protein [Clostridium sp.]|nr:ATP-binding protein [Clostridium sp.]